MKRIFSLAIALVIVAAVVGCVHREVSSKEEALYATRTLSECKEILSYLSIEGKKDAFFRDDVFFVSGKYGPFLRVHVVIYRDNREATQVAIWDDQRPPQQIKVK